MRICEDVRCVCVCVCRCEGAQGVCVCVCRCEGAQGVCECAGVREHKVCVSVQVGGSIKCVRV